MPLLTKNLLFICLSPILLLQGLWVRKKVPRLPEAEGVREGVTGNGIELRLLVVGDSSAAGVGVPVQSQALTGQLVSQLSSDYKVHWKLIAQTGWSTSELRKCLYSAQRCRYDVVLTATGINDITSSHSIGRCVFEQKELVELLREKYAVRHILISGMPPVHRFPSLPEPLRAYLGDRAKRLDDELKSWVQHQKDCDYIRLDFPIGTDYMASDGFHPGPGIYTIWGEVASDRIKARW